MKDITILSILDGCIYDLWLWKRTHVVKFFIPPTMGNVTALNLTEWCSLLKNTIYELKYQLRDKSVEKAMYNRGVISQNWMTLFETSKCRNGDV